MSETCELTQAEHLVAIPTPNKSGVMKMATVGAVQGTRMDSMASLKTTSQSTAPPSGF